ncbi:MAG: glucuronate isomerase [Caldicoprobacterales bacterium]|jgi:hypothetical protein|nr:glucuronate isomerase [Clostridiales bacterium]
MAAVKEQDLRSVVNRIVDQVRITDVHTHLYTAGFGDMLLWGVDELLTYHYLIAETFRYADVNYDEFWKMSKKEQADLIWKTLFIDNSPYSESCRGVLTVLHELGLDVSSRDLDAYRQYFADKTVDEYVDIVFEISRVKNAVMTNDPFDEKERAVWEKGVKKDERFFAALRIDPLLINWENVWSKIKSWGYNVEESLTEDTYAEVRRFLSDWIEKMDAVYMAVSLSNKFRYPDDSVQAKLIEHCILPVCRDKNIPFALMIGVNRQINPDLRLAGDAVGKSDIEAVNYLCANYPKNKFMVTMLSRENQHELAVTARKFRNLLIFGCWWFLNNPSIIDEITRMRFELLGSSIIPQHSDARVLDQLIYKWSHSRKIIANVLYDKYKDIMDAGWVLTEEEIQRDVEKLFGGAFWDFLNKKL